MPHLLPHPRSRRPRHAVFTAAAGSLALLAFALTACTSTSPSATGSPQPVSVTASGAAPSVRLSGAGSTFDAPFFDLAFAKYQQQHPGVAISYSSVGSSVGITAFTAGAR
jgi:phosphate transport system substrate-binding protein